MKQDAFQEKVSRRKGTVKKDKKKPQLPHRSPSLCHSNLMLTDSTNHFWASRRASKEEVSIG